MKSAGIVLVRLSEAADIVLGFAFAENSDAAAFRDHIQPISTKNYRDGMSHSGGNNHSSCILCPAAGWARRNLAAKVARVFL